MAWKEVSKLEQRREFVLLTKAGIKDFRSLCAEFGISRKTGYKWWNRFKADGLRAMKDQSRRPNGCPHKTPKDVQLTVLKERRKHPTWGPKKLRQILKEDYADLHTPSVSTIGAILKRTGVPLKKRRKRGIYPVVATALTHPEAANDVWAADFKGWFRTKDGSRCDPLTVTDLSTRNIIGARILPGPTQRHTQRAFVQLFKRYGLPLVIRVDNGSPFATMGIGRLSALSVWWMELGIRVELTRPGCPQDNGSHERMHRTFKAELTKPVSPNRRSQQLRIDRWRKEYNEDRPHEALGMKKPAQLYRVSPRRHSGKISPIDYPEGYERIKVDSNGFIRWQGHRIYLGETLSNKRLGLKPLDNGCKEVYFANRVLGELTPQTRARLRPPAYAVRAFKEKSITTCHP